MSKKSSSFNNLIDFCLKMEEDPDLTGDVGKQFACLVMDYFFANEKSASRGFELFLQNLPPPPFVSSLKSIYDIQMGELESYVRGGTLNDSMAGKIMLSPHYLKAFYPHHAPSFNKLPEDVRFELMDKIKGKNEGVLSAFAKMMGDREADRRRKLITLIALVLKNIHLRTGAPMNSLPKPAEEIIRSVFSGADEVFTASQKQMAELQDDTKIKQIVKAFFMIKQFKDISAIALLFKEELGRFRKRTNSARS
ncbi:MAG: hypothetical protein E4G96_03040 [Chrysiogenales bacterium]|nr:MAG: hypothetical protein E4G96_03040 [Chrysiogenales bacterium]